MSAAFHTVGIMLRAIVRRLRMIAQKYIQWRSCAASVAILPS